MKNWLKTLTLATLASIVWGYGVASAAVRPSNWVPQIRIAGNPQPSVEYEGFFTPITPAEVAKLKATNHPSGTNLCVMHKKMFQEGSGMVFILKPSCATSVAASFKMNTNNGGVVVQYPTRSGYEYLTELTKPAPAPAPAPTTSANPPLPVIGGNGNALVDYNSLPTNPTPAQLVSLTASVVVEKVKLEETVVATDADIQDYYLQLLGRSATRGEIWKWKNQLSDGTVGQIQAGITASQEYADWQACKEDFADGLHLDKTCKGKIQTMLTKDKKTKAKAKEKRSKPSKNPGGKKRLAITGEKAGVVVQPPYIGCPRGEQHMFQGQVDEVIHFLVCRPRRQKGLDSKGYTLLMGHLSDLRVVSVPQAQILKTDCGRFSTYHFQTPHGELIIRPLKDAACDGKTGDTWSGKKIFARYR